MSKMTLLMCERSRLGGWEGGVGSSGVIGNADTGQISTVKVVMATTTSRLVKRRLGELSSEVDIMGATVGGIEEERGGIWESREFMNQVVRETKREAKKKQRPTRYAQRPSVTLVGCLLHRNGQRETSMDPGRESCGQWEEETAARGKLKNRDNWESRQRNKTRSHLAIKTEGGCAPEVGANGTKHQLAFRT